MILADESTQKKSSRSKSGRVSTADPYCLSTKRQSADTIYGERFALESYAGIPMRKPVAQWNQSAAVLRNSNIQYTIPKNTKLKDPKINYYDHYKLSYKSTLSNRATQFGRGNKANIPTAFNNKVDDAAVDAPYYEIDDMKLRRNKSQTIKRGKTFSSYQSKNVKPFHRDTVHCPQNVISNPGPNKYQTSRATGSTAPKSTMHSRLRMFSQIRGYDTTNEPGPQSYKISENQIRPATSLANFGYAKKSDFTNIPQKSGVPAPIYNIPGFCDKYKINKMKNLGLKYN